MSTSANHVRLLSPSKVTAWLDCAHYLTLQHGVEAGTLDRPGGSFGEFAQMLLAKGLEHERQCLAHYQAIVGDVYTVPDRQPGESFAAWVERVGDVLSRGHEVVYQMPFVHDGMRGIADFLVRCDLPGGGFTYEPLDAKLARSEAKPGHVLQLCFYAEAIEAAGLPTPESLHIWLGSGHIEPVRFGEVRAYWQRLRRQLRVAMTPQPDAPPTRPVRCNHCGFCEFAERCDAEWRTADALHYVANIRSTDIAHLEDAGVATMAALAEATESVEGLDPTRQERLVLQASLQVRARQRPDELPPLELLPAATPEEAPTGFGALPEPDDGDVFLDYEGHPFWRADTGLFFLFGILTRSGGEWVYEARWAHNVEEEGQQARALIEWLAARRLQHPGMHVYHYNHTERTALERMAEVHGADQQLLQRLIETGLFVDLLEVVRQALVAGVESYGLKHMERFAGFVRREDIHAGSGAVVEYERYRHDGAVERLTHIAAYNEDDVRATLALRDWLLDLRDGELPWRVASIEPAEEEVRELDEVIARLHQHPEGSAEHLMGDLLGYWIREGRANTAQLLAKAGKDPADLRSDPGAISGLQLVGIAPEIGARGRPLTWQRAEFRFPPQTTSPKFTPRNGRANSVCYTAADGLAGWAEIVEFSADAGTITLQWKPRNEELGVVPEAVALSEWVPPRPKPDVLKAMAQAMLDGTITDSAAMALLRADAPRFAAGGGPAAGEFTDDVADVTRWVHHLDRSCVAIQGPPGTGKTWMGAHTVHSLVKGGKRVGITAMSHHAIDNLLKEVVEVFGKAGDLGLLNAVRRGANDSTPTGPFITCAGGNGGCTDTAYNVVAGTTWLFASKDMRGAPVDVLLVDEAGQLGLADALAAASSAGSVVLLGDPLQLPQVAQASHPNRSGVSVLEHLLGEGVATVPPERGVFLTQTRRMHPDVCRFISEQIYEGRLGWHESCERQSTSHGTGLRWLQAHHAGCSTESSAEADLVIEQARELIGSKWIDGDGKKHDVAAGDIMVVAPYNDQVNRLRRTLEADPDLAGVKVGTVDKFQGQQAPVVFFTMTTSTAADMPRETDFLFSRNRLNVALSRARCLAYVVCTEELLNSRARDVEDMKLISTLCAAVEYAGAAERTRT